MRFQLRGGVTGSTGDFGSPGPGSSPGPAATKKPRVILPEANLILISSLQLLSVLSPIKKFWKKKSLSIQIHILCHNKALTGYLYQLKDIL